MTPLIVFRHKPPFVRSGYRLISMDLLYALMGAHANDVDRYPRAYKPYTVDCRNRVSPDIPVRYPTVLHPSGYRQDVG